MLKLFIEKVIEPSIYLEGNLDKIIIDLRNIYKKAIKSGFINIRMIHSYNRINILGDILENDEEYDFRIKIEKFHKDRLK